MLQITAQRLRELLHYDPATGIFRWTVARGSSAAGDKAGCLHKVDGYVYITVDGRTHKAHRLAWLYVHGALPPAGLDHADGVRSHNAIANLRPATQAENMQNLRRPHRDNRTGFLGVYRTRGGRYIARVKAGELHIFGKKCDTPQQAHQCYLEIKALFHPFATIGARTLPAYTQSLVDWLLNEPPVEDKRMRQAVAEHLQALWRVAKRAELAGSRR